MLNKEKIYPIVLCGGDGKRLWPISRKSLPKQFLPLIDQKSLLDITLQRLNIFETTVCICGEEHQTLVQNAVDQFLFQPQKASIILEPEGRNTAAAIAAAAYFPEFDDDDILLILPADHYIPDSSLLNEAIFEGVVAAKAGYIVTFGAKPTSPSSAYGYLQVGDALNEIRPNLKTRRVERYVEKPNELDAKVLFKSGDYLWNMGIFLCRVDVLRMAFEMCAPEISSKIKVSMQNSKVENQFMRPERRSYLDVQANSFDYAVMELFDRTAVVPYMGLWSDVGGWQALFQLVESDNNNNKISGFGQLHGSHDTYIYSDKRLVVGVDLENLLIVDTPDALLVAKTSGAEKIKDLVNQLNEKNIKEATNHVKVHRPWGFFETIFNGDEYKVKLLTIKPGALISLQRHEHRSEHWVIVNGTAKVTKGNQIFELNKNQSVCISIGEIHRLENTEKENLQIIEIQLGKYLGDDDIVRLSDIYKRI